MSSHNLRHTPSPAPSSPSHNHPTTSKLPKFLQKQSNRDRSKSVTDPGPHGSPTSSSLASDSNSVSPEPAHPHAAPTKSRRSKFLGLKDKDKDKADKSRKSNDTPPHDHNSSFTSAEVDEPPVIVEPVSIPRSRTRSERHSGADSQSLPALYSSTSSTSRIGDLPTRLSGWFSHLSNSSSDLSLPALLAQQSSPKSNRGPSALLIAAKNGRGHLDKAMRYLLDSDATPDKCTDPIWLLGVQHPGYEPSDTPISPTTPHHPALKRASAGSPPLRASTSSMNSTADLSLSQSTNSKQPNPAANWPPVFYLDFTSRIWLTYRSQFPIPIRDLRLGDLCGQNWEQVAMTPVQTKSRPWNWGGEKNWSSDSGWGCMLRTGQSVLANALIHHHLGRDWRRPPHPVLTADFATYVQILTWFLDTPSPDAPFSVHRMALAGKELGTDVGQWFGPSVAAGALRTLVHSFPECGMSVAVASDSTLYQSQVYAASHGETSRSPKRRHKATWGDRPVLLLLPVRLGIDGVNPIYYESVKMLYTFPQSVGIAGGRPSSSYYFVGSQANNLFYLDPHNARPAIPLRLPGDIEEVDVAPESDYEYKKHRPKHARATTPIQTVSSSQSTVYPSRHQRNTTSPSSIRTGSSIVSAPVSPSPLSHQLSGSSTGSSYDSQSHSRSPPPSYQQHVGTQHGRWRSASASQPGSPAPLRRPELPDDREMTLGDLEAPGPSGSAEGLDAIQIHYCNAYSAAELKTFHCERVRKMPLSGLDPSMLIGFLCRDEADWEDFKRRVEHLPRQIFSLQDEPPSWPSDSDDNMGLESISEPDPDDILLEDDDSGLLGKEEGDRDDEDEEDEDLDDGEGEQFFDTRSESASMSSASGPSRHGRSDRSRSEDLDTEEDPVDPLTPGANSKFDIIEPRRVQQAKADQTDKDDDGVEFPPEDDFNDDIEDDWIDPSLPTPTPSGHLPPLTPPTAVPARNQTPQKRDLPPRPLPAPPPPKDSDSTPSHPSTSSSAQAPTPAPRMSKSKSSSSAKSGSGSKSTKKKKQLPVPVPQVRIPSQGQSYYQPQPPQEHYPFPVTPADDGAGTGAGGDRSRNTSNRDLSKRMHTARARDGGRTQSGGVKGILTDD
ncbi:peptidase family C54-domain-containing protein [Panaeolus papilionaceus]|nr:peptidase family C54-domain-containing protein [Panaeolus papilionaceus]